MTVISDFPQMPVTADINAQRELNRAVLRNITISGREPTDADGEDGEIWIVLEAD